ncbi:MAG: hypothetical protein P4L42_06570 [Desulfocapsaceae bacterium]|nr:hypothetical protein [Desulfocapsaceae bacterium]
MEETYITRIPKLTDAELQEYIKNSHKYTSEAVELALHELGKRGYCPADEDLLAIRDAARRPNTAPLFFKSPWDKYSHRFRPRYLRLAAALIVIGGVGCAVIVYLTAEPAALPPLGYDPMTTKTTLREMQLYGGMANVLATQFRQWFAGLWHGRPLAFILAFISLSVGYLLWRLSMGLQTCPAGETRKRNFPAAGPDHLH